MKRNCGIYQIKNIVNGKCYIGQTIDLYNREHTHFYSLENNKKYNKHLQYAWNKYGKNNFVFSVLLYCEEFELTKYERFFDNYYKELNLSYNIRECVDSNKGITFSLETKEKMSKSAKGKSKSEKTRKKMSESKKGRIISEDTKKKLSIINTGINHPNYGNHLSDETKKKISKSHKGKTSSQKGKPHSLDYNKKISNSLKEYWKNKKEMEEI
jgi:group I intron endonuclease